MTADFTPGARCDQATEAAGVGRGRDALVAAIQARPSLVSTPPVPVTIGGYPGLSLDLRLAPGWTGGCVSPGAGAMVGAPIVIGLGAGALVGVGPDAPVRLILVDVGDDQAMAVVVFSIQPSGSARFEDLAAAATPIIESLELTRSGH
jgi:hypothetical protein